ncbi:MAG: DUF362 domain-containing protein [Promethearchaeota archaeon]|jgi:uncharacterized protein (DUF362 family)
MKSSVFIKPIEGDMTDCVRECFDNFGGVESICKGKVFIKFNGTGPMPDIITDREVLLSTVKVVMEKIKPENIYVMENSAVGFCTRHSFEIDDLGKRVEELGANPLYLEEQEPIDVDFKGIALDKPIPIPKILYENLVDHKGENTYINVPKLKSHIQCGVTICIKNQHGLFYDKEKVYNHHLINEKIVDALNLFVPNYNIVDATTVINFGPSLIDEEYIIPMGLLLSGTDLVAVDTIGSRLVGIDDAVHIEMAAKKGFGTNNFEEIEVLPSKDLIDKHKIQLEHNIDNITIPKHDSVTYIRGSEQACKTGCSAFESFRIDPTLKIRPYVLVYGKGHNTTEIDKHSGPFVVNGPCAVSELEEYFNERQKNERTKVFYINEHVDIENFYKSSMQAGRISLIDLSSDTTITAERFIQVIMESRKNGGNFMSIV